MTMEISNPRIRSLMRQAQRIADNGKRAAAEKLYRQILEEAPGTTQAWVGLAGVLADPDQQETAYQHALALDPENEQAQMGLALLRDEEPPAVAATEKAGSAPIEIPADPFNQSREWLRAATERPKAAGRPAEPAPPPDAPKAAADAPIPAPTAEDEGDLPVDEAIEAAGKALLVCTNHPQRKTNLRCNRCGKPICSACARPTPVGYRCPDCIREQEDQFFSANLLDYGLAVVVSLPLALLAGLLAARIGFFVIFLAAFAGSLIGRVAFRAARRHRGRWLPHTVATAVAIGGVLPALPYLIDLLSGSPISILRLMWLGIYVVVATGAAFYQVK
jgi:tetratricopeptide (TPR) repeat protein